MLWCIPVLVTASLPLPVSLAASLPQEEGPVTRAELKVILSSIQSQLDDLKEANAGMRQRLEADEAGAAKTPPASSGGVAGVAATEIMPSGVASHGRRASSPTCCRWTADDACSAAGNANLHQCTKLHEYLEHKTTTHEFLDLDSCLGSDHSKWTWSYRPDQGDVQLSTNDSPVSSVKTPLKVTHASACASSTPTLTLQLDTEASGSLSVSGTLDVTGAFSVGGVPVGAPFVDGVPGDDSLLSISVAHSLTDLPGLAKTVTLDSARFALIQYHIGWSFDPGEQWNFLHTVLLVDGIEKVEARDIDGVISTDVGTYGNNMGVWIGTLAAGTHTIKVQYRTFNNNVELGGTEKSRTLQVLIL